MDSQSWADILNLDHERLTYEYAGRPLRLTRISGMVAKDALAVHIVDLDAICTVRKTIQNKC
jgi:hypothetical protein